MLYMVCRMRCAAHIAFLIAIAKFMNNALPRMHVQCVLHVNSVCYSYSPMQGIHLLCIMDCPFKGWIFMPHEPMNCCTL